MQARPGAGPALRPLQYCGLENPGAREPGGLQSRGSQRARQRLND